MKVFLSISLFSMMAFFSARSVSGASSIPTLCSEDEGVYFSCVIKGSGKIASLCGSKQLGVDGSFLQYRFGKSPTPEMQYPLEKKGSLKQFVYERYFRALVGRVTISFSNNGYDYEVFSDQDAEQKPPIVERGVRVYAPGKNDKVTTLLCGAQYIFPKTDALGDALSPKQ